MARTSSIRFRLTAWFTAALLAALALFGVSTWIAVRLILTESVDRALSSRMDALGNFLLYTAENVPPQEWPEELREFAMGAPEGRLLEVRDADGRVLLRASRVLPQVSTEMTLDGKRYRTLFKTIEIRGKRYQAVAAANLDQRAFILRRFGIMMLLAIPPVLLIAGAGGLWLSRRALRPVDEMTEAASSIGIDNLSRRLVAPATGDELERLATTWNQVLDRLERSVKRLSQFTADASHELRSPIAFIRTAAEIALRQERTAEAYRESLGQIHDESERMSRLIEDLLTLARADAGAQTLQLAPLDMRDLVERVCAEERRHAAEKALELEVRLPGETVLVEGNDPAVRRLLRVLLENAIRYTPSGGRIEVSLNREARGVELAVRDTGIGIPEADLARVFDRFYRADKARSRDEGGSGLGLSIAQWIARCHRAEIRAESESGRGSVFRVAFSNRP